MATEDSGRAEVAAPTDLRALHARAARRFLGFVQRIQPSQWDAPTPCSDWDVRTLVDHVVRWNTLVPEFLAGRSLGEMVDPLQREVLGEDPLAAAAASVKQALDAFDVPGALERIIRYPFGEIPGAEVMYLRLVDNAIHGWDLARALGIDADIELDVAQALYAASLPQREPIRASGHFGPAEVAVADDADIQTRLLGLLGRRA